MDIEKRPDFDIGKSNFGYHELLFDIQNYWTNVALASHEKELASHVENVTITCLDMDGDAYDIEMICIQIDNLIELT